MSEEYIESQNTKKDAFTKAGEYLGYTFVGIIVLFLFYGLFKGASLGYNAVSPFHGNTNQKTLTKILSVAISNKTDLSAVKTIFNNREIDNTLYARWLKSSKGTYLEPINLSSVLKDMRASYYLSDKRNEEYLAELDALIKENNEVNPFDKLQSHQKDYFMNVRIKLQDQYSLVENDIIKLSDNLNKQNELVKEYLSDATASLFISVTGLAFALLVTIIQITQNKKNRLNNEAKYSQLLEKIEKS